MRSYYSIAIVALLLVGALAQSETTTEGGGAPVETTASSTTEKMPNDGVPLSGETSAAPAVSSASTTPDATTQAPPLVHSSGDSVTPFNSGEESSREDITPKPGNPDAAVSTTAKPEGNGATPAHSSIACAVLTLLPVLLFSS